MSTPQPAAPLSPIRNKLLWLVSLGFFMQTLDGTIVNTALPAMASDLGESPLQMHSVIVAYSLAMAVLIPASGWLADKFGTRRVFMAAIALFVLIYLRYTKHGYELTVVGDNITTARYAGMPVNRIILRTMFISAGVCGLSGMIQASGANKMLTDSVAGGDGFTAIIVAWLARLSPVGILIVAVMFGVLKKGCASVETVYKISSEFFGILQGIILFFVLGVEFFITYRVQRKKEVK